MTVSRREQILTVLHGKPQATATEIAQQLDVNRGSVHHELERLAEDGQVARSDSKHWHVT